MKKFLLSVVALATCLISGATEVPYSIGAEDCTNGYSTSGSDNMTLKNGQTVEFGTSVKTQGTETYMGAVVCVRDGSTLKVALRVDHFENVAWSNAGITSDYDWTNFSGEINGSTQNISVSLLNGTLTIVNKITTSSNLNWTETYTKTGFASSEYTVCLGSDHAYVTISSQAVTGEEVEAEIVADTTTLSSARQWASNISYRYTYSDLTTAINTAGTILNAMKENNKSYTQEQVDAAVTALQTAAVTALTAAKAADEYTATVGEPDFSTAYLAATSEPFTLADGDEATITFINYNKFQAGNWNNWDFAVKLDDATAYGIVVRADNWENVEGTNANSISEYNWGSFSTDLSGAQVTLVAKYANGQFSLEATEASESNSSMSTKYVKTGMTAEKLTCCLTVDNSFIGISSYGVPSGADAVDAVVAEVEAQPAANKYIKNGRLVIENGGVQYNAAGAVVK